MGQNKQLPSIRVCQIWDYYLPTFTGAAIRHNHLATELGSQGILINVLTPQRDNASLGETINGVEISRVPLHFIKSKTLQRISMGIQLCSEIIVRCKQYDLVHAMSNSPFYLPAFLVAKMVGKPVILDFTLLDTEERSLQSKILYKLAFLLFRLLDGHVGISTPLIQQMLKYGLPVSKCHLIPVGVYTNQFTPLASEQRGALRAALGLRQDALYLTFVGTFLERKGIDVLIEMMKILHSIKPDIHLVIVGKHEFSERYPTNVRKFAALWKERIHEYALDNYIHLTGETKYQNVIRWLQTSDVFIFPSRREGFGRVIIEAMSVGLPCICSSLDGIIYDMIKPDINGVVVEQTEPALFAQHVIRLADNPTLRQQLGKSARESVVDNFDESKFALAYRELFESLTHKVS